MVETPRDVGLMRLDFELELVYSIAESAAAFATVVAVVVRSFAAADRLGSEG